MNNFAIWPKVQFGLYLAQIVVQPAHVITRHVFGRMSEPPTRALDVATMHQFTSTMEAACRRLCRVSVPRSAW
jgi:hypothetical protein